MIKILSIFIISITLAGISEQNTKHLREKGAPYYFRDDYALLLLILMLTLFAGLRTAYNDTAVYMEHFRRAQSLGSLFANPANLAIFANPLFSILESLLRGLTSDAQVLIFVTSAFVQTCNVCFLKRYSENFFLSIFFYFALGTFTTTLAIIKQSMAVAVFTLGFHFLKDRKWPQYYLIVFIAIMFHSFAVVFAVLPLFDRKPWSSFTFAFVGVALWALFNFQEAIEEFLYQAENLGLDVSVSEITDAHTVNIFRVAVYVIPPLFSLIFVRYINPANARSDNIMIHMSIISMVAMMMGTQSGANIFARMAHYFELGTVCCLPGMLKKPFVESSHRLVALLAILGFIGFFLYGVRGFDDQYYAVGLFGMF